MILTDREIRIAVHQGLIRIDPAPGADAYSSTSVDLILAAAARAFRDVADPGTVVDPGARDFSYLALSQQLTEPIDLSPQWALKPRKLLLAWTTELLDSCGFPRSDPARDREPRSIGRHPEARHEDCQLIFEATLGTPEKGYAGIFSGQRSG